jgi:hypothetical protein
MQSDVRALLRILLWAGAVALVFMAVPAGAVAGWLGREVAVGVGLGVILVGGILVGRFASRGLIAPRKPRPDAEPPDAPSDLNRM